MASYPSSIVVLPTHNSGDTIQPSDVNNPDAEIVAVETGLLNGTQHNVKPQTDNTYDLGDSSHAWKNLWTKGTTQFNGVAYTWPAADGSAGQTLSTNGSKVLSWINPGSPVVQEFRLTLTTGVPVTTADVTAAGTLYFSPYTGRRCSTFDASGNATVLTSAEISIAVPASTSQMYDVFVFNNAGVLTLELLAWSSDSARATAIVRTGGIDAAGVYTKSGDTTRRYVGSFRTTGVANQTEDSAVKRYLWNYYNRVRRPLTRTESTASWTYSTATIRQANGAAANQVEIVVGVAEALLELNLYSMPVVNNSAGVTALNIGIGEDSTTTFTVLSFFASNGSAATVNTIDGVTLIKNPTIGRHFYSWNEWSQANATTTWYGASANGGAAAPPTGLTGWIEG